MRYVLFIGLLFAMCVTAFAEEGHELNFKFSGLRASSLTDTRVRPSTKIGVDFFPGGKNVGGSYYLEYRHPYFNTPKPFTVDHSELMHSFGLVARLRDEGRFQPMIRGGVMRYIGHTRVRRFDEILINARDGKFIPSVGVELDIRIWKRFTVVPEMEISGFPRPQYNYGVGLAYGFNFWRK